MRHKGSLLPDELCHLESRDAVASFHELSPCCLQDAGQPAKQSADRAPLRCAALGCGPPGCRRSIACQLCSQRPSLLPRARRCHHSGGCVFFYLAIDINASSHISGHKHGCDLLAQALVSALNTVVLGLLLPPQHKQVIRLMTVQNGGLRTGLSALPAHVFASNPTCAQTCALDPASCSRAFGP